MLNELINGVAEALSKEFDSEYKIYIDEKTQGFTTPCFFIVPTKMKQTQIIGKRYFNENTISVKYYSKLDTKADNIETLNRLFECLEYIYIGEERELMRGTKMGEEVTDGILQFSVSYNAFIYKLEESEIMEKLETEFNYKGEKNE